MTTLRRDAGRRLPTALDTAFGDAGPGVRTRVSSYGAPSGGRWSRPPSAPLSRELASVHRRIRLWLPLDARELTEDRS
ncbi:MULTISPECIES: hypothetical protein [unclassified Streptomyces]|uniref:hypothetical protein n=1 Tax=unclassified Streptomyces TaxID=2593676 RepID=UPI00225C019A|nr:MULTISPECIES: hypothetical protein [unclassified Streptomyces]MCX4411004.1 hypothetical protein [Streptomyces sp. NBC_01764]MCX5186438.1 hypothetical protein [Streptomyces sp. NBC_00268]